MRPAYLVCARLSQMAPSRLATRPKCKAGAPICGDDVPHKSSFVTDRFIENTRHAQPSRPGEALESAEPAVNTTPTPPDPLFKGRSSQASVTARPPVRLVFHDVIRKAVMRLTRLMVDLRKRVQRLCAPCPPQFDKAWSAISRGFREDGNWFGRS